MAKGPQLGEAGAGVARGSIDAVSSSGERASTIDAQVKAMAGFDPLDPPPVTRTTQVVYPHMLNHQGNLFGGEALQMMDTAAYIAAQRLTRAQRMVTAAVQDVDYVAPVREGEIVEIVAVVERVGRTSVTVVTTMIGESLETGERRLCGRGRIVLVALGDDEQPAAISRG